LAEPVEFGLVGITCRTRDAVPEIEEGEAVGPVSPSDAEYVG
jgi:hypothetical protein